MPATPQVARIGHARAPANGSSPNGAADRALASERKGSGSSTSSVRVSSSK
jgi:hypothetical protein